MHIGVNKVWVIGSSIVKRASIASRERKRGLNLGIVNTEIWWQGYGGMVLSQLLPKLRVLRRIENDPDVLIIHCGANSLGLIELKSLLEKLQDTLEQIAKLFPRSKLVWSNLLPRFNWRYSEDIRAMEDSRKRVNREAILLVTSMGGGGGLLNILSLTVRTQHYFMMTVFICQKKGNDSFLENIEKVVTSLLKVEGEENEQALAAGDHLC